ncbi:unnamed protein product, partial [Meganyctiphanes norvegica]
MNQRYRWYQHPWIGISISTNMKIPFILVVSVWTTGNVEGTNMDTVQANIKYDMQQELRIFKGEILDAVSENMNAKLNSLETEFKVLYENQELKMIEILRIMLHKMEHMTIKIGNNHDVILKKIGTVDVALINARYQGLESVLNDVKSEVTVIKSNITSINSNMKSNHQGLETVLNDVKSEVAVIKSSIISINSYM